MTPICGLNLGPLFWLTILSFLLFITAPSSNLFTLSLNCSLFFFFVPPSVQSVNMPSVVFLIVSVDPARLPVLHQRGLLSPVQGTAEDLGENIVNIIKNGGSKWWLWGERGRETEKIARECGSRRKSDKRLHKTIKPAQEKRSSNIALKKRRRI